MRKFQLQNLVVVVFLFSLASFPIRSARDSSAPKAAAAREKRGSFMLRIGAAFYSVRHSVLSLLCASKELSMSLSFFGCLLSGTRPSCRLCADLVWRAGGTFEFPPFTYRYLLLSAIFESEDVTAETAGKSSRALYFSSLFLGQKTKTKQARIKNKAKILHFFFCL